MRIGLVLGALVCLGLIVSERHVAASVIASHGAYERLGDGLFSAAGESDADLARTREQWVEAKARVADLLGPLESEPIVVLPPTKSSAVRYGVPEVAPGGSFSVPWVTYIVLAPDGRNVDVMAHELVHAELAERLGYLRYSIELPTWFDEGLAMQVDHRDEKIAQVIRDGVPLPPVSELTSVRDFNRREVALSYAASQIEVATWLSAPGHRGAGNFVRDLARGGDFDALYRRAGGHHDDAVTR
jgi:hypothetical protein